MFDNLIQNTTKNQQIAILILSQIFVAIIVVVLFSIPSPTVSQEVAISSELESVPTSEQQIYAKQVYQLLAKAFPDAPVENAQVVVREGTYEEITNSGITAADFLVDVDEYEQTYSVHIEWSKTEDLSDNVSVDCPKKQEMKYPETYCVGRYYNTDSVDLYIPYETDVFQMMLNYSDKTQIDVYVEAKDESKYSANLAAAQKYLNESGIDFSVYKTNYIKLTPGS